MSFFKKAIETVKKSEDWAEFKATSWRDWVSGKVLTKKFLLNQILLFLMIMFLFLFYNYNRYASEAQQRRKIELQHEIKNLHYELLLLSDSLTQISLQSNLQQMIEAQGLTIKESKTPTIIIKD